MYILFNKVEGFFSGITDRREDSNRVWCGEVDNEEYKALLEAVELGKRIILKDDVVYVEWGGQEEVVLEGFSSRVIV